MTALAALYPLEGRQAPPPSARYNPPPPTPPLTLGVRPDAPAFGSVVSGMAPFAGETVPLPAGDWVVVAAIGGKLPNGKAGNGAMLAQVVGNRAAAVIVLSAFGLPGEAGTGFPRFPSCQETRNIYSRVFTARDGGEQACWSIDALAVPWNEASAGLLASGAVELRHRGAELPEVMVRTRFARANQAHLLFVEVYQAVDLPPEGRGAWDWSHIMATPERLAVMTRARDWAVTWWPLVDRGFANRLGRADILPALARLPW